MAAPYDFFDYQKYWEDRSFENECEKICLTEFFKKIEKKDSLIDVGGGFGRLASLYSPLFKECLIFDPSEKLLSLGKKNNHFSNIKFKKGSLPKIPFPKNSFDVALMVRVSHHLPNLLPSIKEISRILKPGGFFILEIANKIHFLARIKALISGKYSYLQTFEPLERRSTENIKNGAIDFSNHHPLKVIEDLKNSDFSVIAYRSVSNFRSPLIKKIIPQKFLLLIEKICQPLLSRFFFGPSIFILSQKNKA